MADPISIGIGAVGLFVAGMTAVANIAAAYGQYRANHPRKLDTGRVDNYTANHQGYSMTQHQLHPEPVPFYATYIDMVRPLQSQPQLQQTHGNYAHQFSIPGYAAPSYPIYQPPPPPPPPPPPRSPSFSEQRVPAYRRAVNRMLGRTSTAPEVHMQVPHHVLRSSSAPTHHMQSSLPYGHGGWFTLSKQQQSPDTAPDTNIGMHTGRMPGYSLEMAQAHWDQFQTGSLNGVEGTIAVVNWSERSIAMYVYSQDWRQYFLNYSLSNYDPEAFAKLYFRYQVFTGILKDSWLVGCNDDLKVVEDDGCCDVKSSNCWGLLGIPGHIGDLLFVEMKRAALFGLIQCRSKDPTLLNVDMVGDNKVQFVHVDTKYKYLETKGNCWFSVFSFKTNGWAEQRVLVG